MAHSRAQHGLVAVAGGMLAVGGNTSHLAGGNSDESDEYSDGEDEAVPNELFDEASGRWFEVPHPMAESYVVQRSVVSLPVAALAHVGAAAAAAPAN